VIIKGSNQREAQFETFSPVPIFVREDSKTLDRADDIFAENASFRDVAISRFVLFRQRVFLAGFFRHIGIGVVVLQTEISQIHHRFYFRMQPCF
jgi:hypothetical protein